MLHLPVELVLSILAYLPVDSLRNLLLVSRSWKEFFESNESTIYRNAAAHHRLIKSSDVPFPDLWSIYSGRSLIGVHGWKSFCRRRFQIDQSWAGKGPSIVTTHPASGAAVHRIKVDEKAGFIITTSSEGGLIVSDLAQTQVLWSLRKGYVVPFAHCEYDNGYLIFNRWGNFKEVWRRISGFDDGQDHATMSHLHPHQIQVSNEAAHTYHATAPRGHFKPWAFLEAPESTTAFRFVYPTLLAVSWNRAYLWDIPTGQLIQTITETQRPADGPGSGEDLGTIRYVELSERHIFTCGENMIRIFSRATGTCVLDIPSTEYSYANWYCRLHVVNRSRIMPSAALWPHTIDTQPGVTRAQRLLDNFVAVHVSPCGRNLVGMLSSSRVVLWYDFERVVRGEMGLRDIALDIQLGSPRSFSMYLAFENGRIAVATGTGLFIIHPDFDSSEIPPINHPPNLSIYRAARFSNFSWLGYISCLQMTDTGVFINWDPTQPLHDFETEFERSLLDELVVDSFPNGDAMVIVGDNGKSDL